MDKEIAVGWEINRAGEIFAKDFDREGFAEGIEKSSRRDGVWIKNLTSEIYVSVCLGNLLVIRCRPEITKKPYRIFRLYKASLWNPDLDDDEYPIAECELSNGQVDEYPIYQAVDKEVGAAAIEAFVFEGRLDFEQGWRIYDRSNGKFSTEPW